MATHVEASPTTLAGVVVITPPTIHRDRRGAFVELYNEELYRAAGIDVQFVQDDISVSTRGVLRGIHGDATTWKLISCLYGRFYFVVVNCDRTSQQFGRWESFVLSDRNRLQVLVPPTYGNGHQILSERAIFHYKQSAYYNRSAQFTYLWNDPRFQIRWPLKPAKMSTRDRGLTGEVL